MSDCRTAVASAHLDDRWKASPHHRSQRGSTTVELVLIAPVLMLLILLVVFSGRLTQANTQVRHAADQAARAASMVSSEKMDDVATRVALGDLANNGVACVGPSVSVTYASGIAPAVTVTVTCTVNRSELAPLAPGQQDVVGRSTEVIDRRRGGVEP